MERFWRKNDIEVVVLVEGAPPRPRGPPDTILALTIPKIVLYSESQRHPLCLLRLVGCLASCVFYVAKPLKISE